MARVPTDGERTLLRLLVGDRALASAGAWREALGVSSPPVRDSDGATVAVLPAVETIVPHLSDYKTFSENISGLLQFCDQECHEELFNVVCRWLTMASPASSSPAFRRWLFAYVDHVADTMAAVDARTWKQAVLVAALQETDTQLRPMLLRLIDRRIGSLGGVVAARPPLAADAELQRLVVFYWRHAERLSRSSTLCAAKFVALARGGVAPSDEMLALLRWGRALEPLFFGNFVADLLTLQALRRPGELDLCVPYPVESFIQTTSSLRSAVLARIQASRHQLASAAQRKVMYVHRAQGYGDATWPGLCDRSVMDWDGDLVPDVISYLSHDLAILPSDVFDRALAVLVVLAACVSRDAISPVQDLSASKAIARSLFGLLLLRSDSPSLMLIMAAIIDLRIASLPIWREDRDAFTEIVDKLSEAVILEVEATKRWVLQTALHQLVLECDPSVVVEHSAFLSYRLPHSTYTVARDRIANAD